MPAVNAASRASLSFSPASGSYDVGDVVSVNILVGSSDQPMNAVSGVVSFPPSKLEVISLSKTDSVLSIWLHEPSFSNSLGTITFEGVALNPGFQGSEGIVVTAYFKITAAGTIPLSFASPSVLANDGKGTPIPAKIGKATFSSKSASEKTPAPSEDNGSLSSRGMLFSFYGIGPTELILIFLAIFVLAGLLFWYLPRRPSTGGSRLKEEIREARQSLHKSSRSLQENVTEQIKLLEKIPQGERFNEEEQKVIKQLGKEVETLESFVEKEIDDIEKEVT